MLAFSHTPVGTGSSFQDVREAIKAYSSHAHGRSECAFRTHLDHLAKELARYDADGKLLEQNLKAAA